MDDQRTLSAISAEPATAIHADALTSDEARLLGGEDAHHAGDFVWRTETSGRHRRQVGLPVGNPEAACRSTGT